MIKSTAGKIAENFTEIWLGLLLFVGLPAVAYLYLDWRAFVAASILFQSIILTMFVYKGSK